MNVSTYEPVTIRRGATRVPEGFRWRGRFYRIESIDRIWRPSQGEQAGQRLYRMRSRKQSFLLVHDRSADRWSVVTSPWRMRLSRALNHLATRVAA